MQRAAYYVWQTSHLHIEHGSMQHPATTAGGLSWHPDLLAHKGVTVSDDVPHTLGRPFVSLTSLY